ncbi:MAG TPA: TlpA disulfide reductase family protein [Bryobacteraceae bacterium]|jgi:peroxiredoxin
MFFRKKVQLPQVGTRAPEFRLARLGGGEAALTDLLAAGPALLAFFKVSCPVCQMTLPFLERIHAGGGLPVYGISQNDGPETRQFAQDYGLRFPMLLDAEDNGFPASNAYGISHVPTTFLVEPDGMVGRLVAGWIKQDILWLGARAGVNPIGADDHVPEWKAG